MATPPDFTSGAVLTAAQMNAVGLWEITSGTVSSGSSFDLTSVFTSDYDSYKLVLTQIRTASTGGSVQFRLLSGATPVSTGYFYGGTQVDIALNAISVFRGNGAFELDSGAVVSSAGAMTTLEIHNPFIARQTAFNGQSTDSRNATGYGGISYSGNQSSATSYNGIRVLSSAFAFTNCTYKLYGYRN
jgi:hypothetical protein